MISPVKFLKFSSEDVLVFETGKLQSMGFDVRATDITTEGIFMGFPEPSSSRLCEVLEDYINFVPRMYPGHRAARVARE
jgi:hypothetical protein